MGTIGDDIGVDEFTPYKIFGDPQNGQASIFGVFYCETKPNGRSFLGA